MPFLTWSRFLSGNTGAAGAVRADAVAKEVARISGLRAVHEAFTWLRTHEREIADFQLEITEVPAPPFQEQQRSAWFCDRLARVGYQAEQDEIANVIAVCEGRDPEAPVVAVSAHLDTIFPRNTLLDVHRDQTRLYGPGISDNGAGLTALWAVAAALQAANIRTVMPLLIVANVGEEGDGNLRGMRHLFRSERWRGRISQMLVLDGSGTDLVVTEALGSRRFEVRILGPGGHSWSDFGVPNPIVAAARAIDVLSRLPLGNDPKSTLSIGTIDGGTSVNAIPESVCVRIDVRSADPQQIERLELEVRRAFENAVSEASAQGRADRKTLTLDIEIVGDRPAAELRPDAPILLALRAVDTQLGIAAKPQRASTDANIPLSLGVDALTIGSGGFGGGAHTAGEWFDPSGREIGLRRILLTLLALAGVEE